MAFPKNFRKIMPQTSAALGMEEGQQGTEMPEEQAATVFRLKIGEEQIREANKLLMRYKSGKWKDIARKMDKTAKPAAAKS